MQHPDIQSDKIYWHKFTAFYEPFLKENFERILEIGILKGDSIRWLRNRYAHAEIFGLDILDVQESWPQDAAIRYFKQDQSNGEEYRKILKSIGDLDLILEDGSHDPLHQKISLMESIPFIRKGGLYILEDLHTSHPDHAFYKNRVQSFYKDHVQSFYKNSVKFIFKDRVQSFYNKLTFRKKESNVLMPLQALLLIDHCKRNSINLSEKLNTIDFSKSLFTKAELLNLDERIKVIHFYKRNVLPDYCYSCKTDDFNILSLTCTCGAKLYEAADSMTAVIEF